MKQQISMWRGEFGDEYTRRNNQTPEELDEMYIKNFGQTRTSLNNFFLNGIDKSSKMLEVGSNMCLQLKMLQQIGFKNLYGVEINKMSIEESKKNTKGIYNIYGEATDLPFKNDWFDLVLTTGLLIHIHPDEIECVLSEIHRCSRRYILCHEFFAEKYTEINYRGNKNVLWKTDFCGLFLKLFYDLELKKNIKLTYNGTTDIDHMFLLEKERC